MHRADVGDDGDRGGDEFANLGYLAALVGSHLDDELAVWFGQLVQDCQMCQVLKYVDTKIVTTLHQFSQNKSLLACHS